MDLKSDPKGIPQRFFKGFPALAQTTYLNTAAWGLMHEEVMTWRQEYDLDFLVGGSAFKLEAMPILGQTRGRIGECFGCAPERVALVPNFSLGLNLLLEGLPKASRVVLLEGDYPSLNWPFETRGFHCREIPADARVEERLLETLKSEPAEVLALSLVQWVNGLLIRPEFLTGLKAEFPDLLIVVDATQYLGALPLDFDASGIDLLGASGYKWMLGGNGNGFFLLGEGVESRLQVGSTGFNSVGADLNRKGKVSLARNLEPGHLDTLNFGSLWCGLGLLQDIGLEQVAAYNRNLWGYVASRLEEAGLLDPVIAGRKEHSGIFNIPDHGGWYQSLEQEGVACSPRGGGIRLSFHAYNTPEDLDRVLEVLKR